MKSKRPFYYHAETKNTDKARDLRHNQTKAEERLWQVLRNRRVLGAKFRRQHLIGAFIADFYCHKAKLVIELDGEIHNFKEVKEYDENRQAEIEKWDIRVIRFRNEEVLGELNLVIEKIEEALRDSGEF